MNLKSYYYIFIAISFLSSCKKYNCECISVYSSPPKGNMSVSSIQTIRAISKSKAEKSCKIYNDQQTTCKVK